MSTTIVTLPTFEAAAEKIVECWRNAGSHKLIRLEGFDGVGKSGLAKLIKEIVVGDHVEGDSFVRKYDKPPPYSACIRQPEFDAAIKRALDSGRVVILDAVCLEEVAPTEKWGRGYVVYVKRLFNSWDPSWHEGFSLEDEPPIDEVHRSIHLYHTRVKPHEASDLIVELPNDQHTMTRGKFSRDRCFDPPGAKIIQKE
jgi:hypothetical protein